MSKTTSSDDLNGTKARSGSFGSSIYLSIRRTSSFGSGTGLTFSKPCPSRQMCAHISEGTSTYGLVVNAKTDFAHIVVELFVRVSL